MTNGELIDLLLGRPLNEQCEVHCFPETGNPKQFWIKEVGQYEINCGAKRPDQGTLLICQQGPKP